MKSLLKYLPFAFVLLISSCKKDKNKVENPQTTNEEELITTLKVHLTNATDTLSFQFKDPDGDGGVNGTADTLRLVNGKNYQCSLEFLDESNPSDVKNITTEIEEEANDHLVCFESSVLTIQITDKDGNMLPIGLQSNWSTKVAGKFNLTVRLRHQPGIKTGDCDKGETDMEVVFPLIIQ